MYSLKNRIRMCLKYLESGKVIQIEAGPTLCVDTDSKEPGFLVTRGDEEEVFQIGSDTAWMSLIQYAREMTKDEFIKMSVEQMDIRLPRVYTK